ncbi:MAG: NAD-dependent epimerase/dehydratase family protein [Roseburia sp.]|nr:NAD-dependent epimerase/dehydratase family protein [Roseburia sp.]
MTVLITGGTVFLSRHFAEYFIKRGDTVYVLNRGTHAQPVGAHAVIADRNELECALRGLHFDAVIDVNAYNKQHISSLLDATDGFEKYILISSSAVYPDTAVQPFTEETPRGKNAVWGDYGLNKIEAEDELIRRVPDAYIIRPPYIYGEYNNVYREAFVFDCAEKGLPFYLPRDGGMKLQFIHAEDVCRFAEVLLTASPKQTVFNVGCEPVTVREWAEACYAAVGKKPLFKHVDGGIEQRAYFPFYVYEYALDVTRMNKLMPRTIGLYEGLLRAYKQYSENRSQVTPKTYLQFIEKNLSHAE